MSERASLIASGRIVERDELRAQYRGGSGLYDQGMRPSIGPSRHQPWHDPSDPRCLEVFRRPTLPLGGPSNPPWEPEWLVDPEGFGAKKLEAALDRWIRKSPNRRAA